MAWLSRLQAFFARQASSRRSWWLFAIAIMLFLALLFHGAWVELQARHGYREALLAGQPNARGIAHDGQGPSTGLLDGRFGGYTEIDVDEWLNYLGEARNFYARRQILLDIPFAVLYTSLLLGCLAAAGASRFQRRPWLTLILLVPLIAGVADLIENIATAVLARAGHVSHWWTGLASGATQTKWWSLIATVLLIGTFASRVAKTLLHRLILVRVPALIAGLLIATPLLAISGPSAVHGLISDLGAKGLFLSGLLTALTAALVVHSGSLIWNNASVRFHARDMGSLPDGKRRFVFQGIFVVGLSLPLLIAISLEQEPQPGTAWAWIGFAVACALLVVVLLLHRWMSPRVARWLSRSGVGQAVRSRVAHRSLGPGYGTAGFRNQGSKNQGSGHLYSTFFFLAVLIVYSIIGVRATPEDGIDLPALVFFLLLTLLLGSLFAGMTFFLDRYRIPLSVALIAWIALMGSMFSRPHTVLLAAKTDNPRLTGSQTQDWRLRGADPKVAAEGRRGESGNALTVVAAAGGGIQASAWTTRVLSGLQQELGENFTRSIHLISAVSGGSTGSYLFAESIDDTGVPANELLGELFEASMKSSLAETGWGLAFADVIRTFTPFLVAPDERHRDRGWAMEQAWRQEAARLKCKAQNAGECRPAQLADTQASSLQQWADDAASGRLPGMILASTVVDDGQQAFFSNLDLSGFDDNLDRRLADRRKFVSDPSLARHFPFKASTSAGIGGVPNLPASTAARLSATFPWISPAARVDLSGDDELVGPSYHFVDGGYFDNFGVTAAVEWLRLLASKSALAPYDKILFIEINAFPQRPAPPPSDDGTGLGYNLLGPLKTILAVRNSSQLSRGLLELDLLKRELQAGELTQELGATVPELHFFEFRPPDRYLENPPLSWKLSDSDKGRLRQSWSAQKVQDRVCELGVVWGNIPAGCTDPAALAADSPTTDTASSTPPPR